MTSSNDVKDMLGIQADPTAEPRSRKKSKPTVKKPDHMSRELFQLVGERPPPIPIAEPALYKAKRRVLSIESAKWRTISFNVSTREDGLVLRHWRKEIAEALQKEDQAKAVPLDIVIEGDTDVDSGLPQSVLQSKRQSMQRMEQHLAERSAQPSHPPTSDVKFARYDTNATTPSYDDAVYEKHLKSTTWSREETDYLVSLFSEFYGKWPVIWDRYDFIPSPSDDIQAPPQRSMEDLKTRFFAVSAAATLATTPLEKMSTAEFTRHEKLTKYDPRHETERKMQKARMLSRSKSDRDEERVLLAELERIYKRRAETEAEGRDLRARLDTGMTRDEEGAMSYTSSAEINGLLQKMFQKDREARALQQRRLQAAGQGGAAASQPQSTQQRGAQAIRAAGSTPARSGISPATEKRFGVKTFDRLPAGVTFKSDRLAKARTAKSTVKTDKIAATLGEMGVPELLQMPTDDVCKKMETVVAKILELIEKKRLLDREENDLRVEVQKKALDEGGPGTAEGLEAVEKGKQRAVEQEEEDEAEDETNIAHGDAEEDEGDDAEEGDEDVANDDEGVAEDEDTNFQSFAAGDEENEEVDEEEDEGVEEEAEEEDDGGDNEEEIEDDADADQDVSMADAPIDPHDDADGGGVKEEQPEMLEPPARPNSRKRSQSVLSNVSGTSRGSRAQSKRRKA